MNHFKPTGFIYRWRSIDLATLLLSDVTDKQTSWLVNVTFDWRQVMTTAVQRYSGTRCLITFLRRVFCTINTESSQLIHRNDLKIKCKYKSRNLIFDVHRVMKPVVVAKILQEARTLAPPTGFITRCYLNWILVFAKVLRQQMMRRFCVGKFTFQSSRSFGILMHTYSQNFNRWRRL